VTGYFKELPVLTIEILESGVTSAAIADVVVVVPLATAAVAASSAAALGHLGFLVSPEIYTKAITKNA